MKKIAIFSIAAAVLAITITGTALADSFMRGPGNGPMQDNFASEDYDAYLEAVENEDFTRHVLSEDEFNEMIARHNEREAYRLERQAFHESVDEAIESGDYDTWASLMESANSRMPMIDFITEDNFDTFVEYHVARQSGDFETASELAESLGLPMMQQDVRGYGMHQGFRNSQDRYRGAGSGQGMHGNCPFMN